ncbi:uncharacterized protein AMSG_02837 [Thecamonas trahens ATCC 50062]|uniref:Uncharacterized protein n=1 Tax=Thecamonas trahens ATCC 50062 TaxID=461836 RepID=A0A0L0D2J8_THETB|nr:hypothetical protein AMSG_02837 [Thecamonas trahens ATCC 50062]KNC46385.1 hypothetical protein AMSG_02837 [Thecamonas trahens ATCC 50062]|eukprot:XP_013760678.1 hypothetical protein AMSG_02837 [Thecamonas trahens ATCC 50062]
MHARAKSACRKRQRTASPELVQSADHDDGESLSSSIVATGCGECSGARKLLRPLSFPARPFGSHMLPPRPHKMRKPLADLPRAAGPHSPGQDTGGRKRGRSQLDDSLSLHSDDEAEMVVWRAKPSDSSPSALPLAAPDDMDLVRPAKRHAPLRGMDLAPPLSSSLRGAVPPRPSLSPVPPPTQQVYSGVNALLHQLHAERTERGLCAAKVRLLTSSSTTPRAPRLSLLSTPAAAAAAASRPLRPSEPRRHTWDDLGPGVRLADTEP